MSNAILATPIISDAATITGSDSVGDMTISNLNKRSLKRKYRSLELSSLEINVDLGSAQNINFFALIAHNLTSLATITVQAGTTDAVSDYSSGSLSGITGADAGFDRQAFFKFLTSGQNYQYWKFTISDASNPDGYIEFGRLYLSNAFQPEINIDYGVAWGHEDRSLISETVNGETVPLIRPIKKTCNWSLSFGSESEMFGTLFDIDRLRGMSKDVIFIEDPDATTYAQHKFIYGLMSELNQIVNGTFELYQKQYAIKEILP